MSPRMSSSPTRPLGPTRDIVAVTGRWPSSCAARFVLDVLVCHACGGRLRILAVLSEGEATRAILDHLGLPITAPVPRAHGPPGGLVVGSTWSN
jgi:hypothetical protein